MEKMKGAENEEKKDKQDTNLVPTEWQCLYCSTWNKWFHHYCKKCLAAKYLGDKGPKNMR